MYRTLPNGDIFVPRKGNIPPPSPDGYVRDGGDYWLFHPVLQQCCNRTEKQDKTCNCHRVILWCEKLNTKITLINCIKCKEK